MIIELAQSKDISKIAKLDSHIPASRLNECIRDSQVYVLKDDTVQNERQSSRLRDHSIVGVLRYSLFWQTIPFVDLLYIDEAYQRKGFGTQMMREWERVMKTLGYSYVMTSTQADEDAWRFYEALGYQKVGGFYPPEQEAEEWMYVKKLG